MTRRSKLHHQWLVAICLGIFGHSLSAMPMVFTGLDSGQSATNSEAEFALWSAAVGTPTVDNLDGLVGMPGVNASFTTSLGNQFSTNDGDTLGVLNFSFAVLQGTSLTLSRNGPSASLVWDIVTPVDSFGFFSRNQGGATITINYAGATSPQTFQAASSNSTGDNLFWGITGLDPSVSSVVISTDGGLGGTSRSLYDRFAYRQAASVPEPTSLSLALMAFGIGALKRAKK